jgi:hypothetical protein
LYGEPRFTGFTSKKGVGVVHVKQRRAGRILFKKNRNYAFSPDGRILMEIVAEQVFRGTKTPSD